jgi:hypothetical protein
VSSNVPLSPANVQLGDLLQHVADVAYEAGKSRDSKPDDPKVKVFIVSPRVCVCECGWVGVCLCVSCLFVC